MSQENQETTQNLEIPDKNSPETPILNDQEMPQELNVKAIVLPTNPKSKTENIGGVSEPRNLPLNVEEYCNSTEQTKSQESNIVEEKEDDLTEHTKEEPISQNSFTQVSENISPNIKSLPNNTKGEPREESKSVETEVQEGVDDRSSSKQDDPDVAQKKSIPENISAVPLKEEIKNLIITPPVIEVQRGEECEFSLMWETVTGDLEDFQDPDEGVQWICEGVDKETSKGLNGKLICKAGPYSGTYKIKARTTKEGLEAEATMKIILPKPEWKKIEPIDQSDPVDHHISQGENWDDQWRVMAASVRGRLHEHKGAWREDSYAFAQQERWHILVMADGAGSANLSRIGSRIACDVALKTMQELLTGFSFVKTQEQQPREENLKQIKTFLEKSAAEAQDAVRIEAHKRGCEVRDLSSTFLLTVHIPWNKTHLIGVLQVGDGAVGIYKKDGSCRVLGDADHGEFSSETVFLTSKAADPLANRVKFTLQPDVECIAIMSDGVSDDFFPEEKNLVHLFSRDQIDGMIGFDGKPQTGIMHDIGKIDDVEKGATSLMQWLQYEKRGSSDDRTLVLLLNGDLTK